MKNSILGKARWLRDVALATSKNNGARVAREWLKYAAMFVMLFTIGSGNAWGAALGAGYTKITNITSLSAGDKVVLYCDDASVGVTGYSGSDAQVSSTEASWIQFTVEKSGSNYFFKTGNNYIQKQTSNKFTIGATSQSDNYCTVNSSGVLCINSRYLCKNNNYYRMYTSISSSYKPFYVYKVAVATPSVTPNPTSLDWGTVLQGSSQENKTISITGANLTEGSLTIRATGGYSVTPTSQNVNGTLDATILTVTPPSTSTTGAKNGKVTISGGGLASDVEIDLSMTVQASHTVTWMVNGSEYATTRVADGSKPEFPSNPSSCDGTSTTFYGWSTSEWSGKIDDISAKTIYTSAASMPTVSGAITYYAVFCKGGGGSEVLNEQFDNDQKTDASNVFESSTFSNFSGATSKAYKSKYGGVKFGTSSAAGYITSKSLDLSKAFTVSIDACKYGSDAGNIEVTVGSTKKTISNSSLDAQGSFKTFVLEFDAATSTSTVKIGTSSKRAYIDNVVITTAGTASQYLTTCQACVAPTSVTITGTNKYLGGQTISLTAAPDGGTGTPSYQWQKKISGVWTNLANDGSISGVTSNNLQISSCTHANSGGYRCIVSTGDGCETKSHADDTNGYGVHVFSIHGKYTTDADYSDTEIIWTSETTGTATISMDAKKTYLFKVWSNNDNYYGHGANTNEDFMFQPTTWDCGVNNNEMRLFTTVAGNYTFTVNIEHGLDGSPYVNVQVGYPSMTHPNSGYVYVQKFNWQPYLHYWYDNSHPLSTWGSDPQLAANQYTSICGTDYWCVPVIDYYCNFIAKDAAGNPSNTTGDQHTNSPHPGQRLYNDGSWKWGEFSTYTITYAGGDGSTGGPMASHTGLCPGSSQQLTANAFSKSGYNFSGWTANVDVKIGGSTVPAGTLITGTPIIENVQSNITLTAQWRDLAQYHVTFSADNGTVAGGASQTVTEGGTLTFPNVTSTTCGTFIGWVEAAYDNTAAPSGVTFHEAGSQIDVLAELDGKIYYAVYRVATGMATNINDELTADKIGTTSYSDWSNLVDASAAIYAGNSTKSTTNSNSIQLRSSDNSGIITTTSGGLAKKVTFNWVSGNTSGRVVDIYGKNSAYSSAADLYSADAATQGTKIGSITYNSTTELTISTDYEYIGIRANKGAAYIGSITIQWYGAPMKYQTSPTCSPMVGVESNFSTFTYAYNAGPSASQSFTVSGSSLGADLVVTAPENYEICRTADGTYTSTIRYTPSDGAVANTTAYIRLAAGLNVGTYNYAAASGLQVTSTGAKTRTAALNGTVTKADCAITFTDFNAVDHYEATLEHGSSVTVSYNYTYNGDGNFSISHSPATGTIDKANKTLTVSVAGIWTLKASATAGTNYSKPSDASAQIRVKCVDTYKDFIHNKTIKAYGSGTAVTDGKMEDWGSGYTVPYIDDNAEETSGSCQQTHYKFMGWVSEDDINIADGTFKTGWTLIQAGTESKLATTKTYYAVWAKLEE